ncbi:MAG: PTS sugar transporter subunit IIA [Dokdonella sp.]
MQLLQLLNEERTRVDLLAVDKQDLLGQLAGLLARDAVEESKLRHSLELRERLGPTALGHGIAIPHGRSPGIGEARAAFVRLATAIDFGASDGIPVDLIAALVVPAHFTDEHLTLLAEAAELFSDDGLIAALRAAPDAATLYRELAQFAARRPA